MSAFPTFPATSVGLVVSLIYTIVSYLARHICAYGLITDPAMTARMRAWIGAFAARPRCLPRNVARLLERAPLGAQPRHVPPGRTRARWDCGDDLVPDVWLHGGVHAGRVSLRGRGTQGERQVGNADPRIAAGGERDVAAGARAWRETASRAFSDHALRPIAALTKLGRTGCQRPLMARVPNGVSAPWPVPVSIASQAGQAPRRETLSNMRNQRSNGLVHGR